jgi:hypothetical protein
MTGNLANTTVLVGPPESTTVFAITSDEPSADPRTHRITLDIMGVHVYMSRADAIALARGILSEAGFVLDGAPI